LNKILTKILFKSKQKFIEEFGLALGILGKESLQ
jgi:hypothetical protein